MRRRSEARAQRDQGLTKVTVEFTAPGAGAVAIAGTFNDWNPEKTPLKHDGSGKWRAELKLAPGRYEYRFVADGEWVDDPNACEQTDNPFGGKNCVLIVE